MTITITGMLANSLGAAAQTVVVPYHGPGRSFDVEKRYLSVPSTAYLPAQPARIPLNVGHDHDSVIGELKFLARNDRALWGVAEIDPSGLGEGPWFFSPEIRHIDGKAIQLQALALTRSPATVALDPIDAFPWPLSRAPGQVVHQHGHAGQLARRAAEYDRRRKAGELLLVDDTTTPARAKPGTRAVRTRRAGQIEYRAAGQVDVPSTGRTVEVVAVTYGTEALVEYRGRMVWESVSNTAFAGVDRQENRHNIKATREHDPRQVFGRVTKLDPLRPDGMLAEIKISRTQLGNDVLELCRDGLLDASIGFRVEQEEWRGTDRRRVLRGWLDHLSLVGAPAYPGTHVVGIRANPHG